MNKPRKRAGTTLVGKLAEFGDPEDCVAAGESELEAAEP